MALSNEWHEYHLTPKGWVEGSEELDFSSQERPTPCDRVLTLRFCEYQSSSFSPVDRSTEVAWRSTDVGEVERLEKTFGSRPARFRKWDTER